MSMEHHSFPGDENQQQAAGEQSNDANQENVQISLPHIDRPEGPFEHSGETSGWTHEEQEEKEQEPSHGGSTP